MFFQLKMKKKIVVEVFSFWFKMAPLARGVDQKWCFCRNFESILLFSFWFLRWLLTKFKNSIFFTTVPSKTYSLQCSRGTLSPKRSHRKTVFLPEQNKNNILFAFQRRTTPYSSSALSYLPRQISLYLRTTHEPKPTTVPFPAQFRDKHYTFFTVCLPFFYTQGSTSIRHVYIFIYIQTYFP
jgi:hypothetical protein